jgi:hypothetical protein
MYNPDTQLTRGRRGAAVARALSAMARRVEAETIFRDVNKES